MSKRLAIIVCFLHVIGACLGHLCIISPRQRGAFDISKGGSSTCFRHGAPCGGQAPTKPRVTYFGGKTAFIKWQQNFNHYTVGFPGFMDVALGIDEKDPNNFTVLAVVQDDNFHAQDHQQNYTAAVVLPNIDCSHCVLRMRYQSHKPGETIFYQCADISIKKTPNSEHAHSKENTIPDDVIAPPIKKAQQLIDNHPAMITPTFYGYAFNKFDPDVCHYVQLNWPNLYVKPIISIPFGISSQLNIQPPKMEFNSESQTWHNRRLKRTPETMLSKMVDNYIKNNAPEPHAYLVDQVMVTDTKWGPGGRLNVTVLIRHDGNLDDPTVTMYVVGAWNGSLVREGPIIGRPDNVPISALQLQYPGVYLQLIIIDAPNKPGFYIFKVGHFFLDSEYLGDLATSESEDTYVNFQWSTFDPNKQLFYALMGNENSPDELDARIYTFDLNHNKVTYKQLDVSTYTIQAAQLYQETGQLLALSPGLFKQNMNPAWALVEVDPLTGKITKLFDVTPAGIFSKYYGGTIINGVNDGIFYYKLSVADTHASVIVSVDIKTGDVAYSNMANLEHIHNLAIIEP
ncbi:unnamed protein product [Owenia fusiformis]|uniref:Uncharacterized protein n=1 Tax=Owenia fusiformis TaxID=6347 RepID=A0A8J1XHL4_OWEFU|nr:unnamed protein product [Owenia fusiformis]